MNRYLPVVPILGIVTIVSLQSQPVLAKERSQIAAQAKEFTVRIEGQETTGTGTIIEQSGDIYTILTCWHVVNAEGSFEVTTVDGEVHQVTEVKNLDDVDLAILRFTSNTSYGVAELGDSQTVAAGTSSYVVGYPDPIPGIPESAYTFQSADIVSKLSTGENGYQIVHSNPTTGGSSGGGIFDNEARLIGVNGRTTSDAEGRAYYGLAIPLELYLAAQTSFTIPASISPPQDFASIGRRKLNQEDYQGAIADFDQALASNPNDLDALSGRGEAYYWLRDFEAAINDFDVLLQRNANDANLFFKRGYAHSQLQEHEKAIADYSEYIRLNPDDVDAYNNRGTNYDDLEEYEKAISDYNEAIRLDSEDVDAYYNRGNTYKSLEEYEQAIADYNEAIRLDSEDVSAYYNRGNTYKNLGEYDKAIADYNEAIRLDPEKANAYYNRGNTYKQLGDRQKAITDFQQAADLYQQQGNTEWYQNSLDRIRELQ